MIGIVGDNVRRVTTSELFRFPDPVNETSARLVAGGVVLQAVLFLVVREGWVLIPLTFGFLARFATGPTLSPLGQFATRLATPVVERRLAARDRALRSRLVAGPPKRFAQAIGLGVAAAASVAWVLDATTTSYVLVAMLAVAASLEAGFALCLGCLAYNAIWGCADCDNISERLRLARREVRLPVAADDVAATG